LLRKHRGLWRSEEVGRRGHPCTRPSARRQRALGCQANSELDDEDEPDDERSGADQQMTDAVRAFGER